MEVLTATDIWKNYKKKKNNNYALRGANLSLHKGEILGLLGPNGAGKTTLIKILATLLRKDSGSVNILGYDLDTHEREIRHFLGYVGQDTERSAYARLTPLENLRFFGALRGLTKDEIDEKAHCYLSNFEFDDILDKQFMHLSGGQKQAVVITRALLHEPPIIFLDEPTKGLDPFAASNIREFLKEYAQTEQKSVVLTSHILSEVDYLADRCSLINDGQIAITDTPVNLKQSVGVTDFIEIEAAWLSQAAVTKISALDHVLQYTSKTENNDQWYSFAVTDLYDGIDEILGVLKAEHHKVNFRHHAISLEDAFIHHIGEFKDKVEV